MKFPAVSLFSCLGISSTQAINGDEMTQAQLGAANQLRGADHSVSKKVASIKLHHSDFKVQIDSVDDQELLSMCHSLSEVDSCNTNSACTWCECQAVPSSCFPVSLTTRLPQGVWKCAKSASTTSLTEKESIVPEMASESNPIVKELEEDDVKILKETKRSQTFNMKKGVTLTLLSDTVEQEFCDPHSSASFAGYMNVKGSQFDTKHDKNLFFWMFEKRATSLIPGKIESPSAEETPFVVWLTGGPGCSSSLALLTENGPCAVNSDGASTKLNPYSWTESAHVLWLDQPANVGYSFGQENDTNEEMISEDAYYFLQAFFSSEDGKRYKDSPLFIVGESYGGHYAPAVAHRIWMGNKSLKEGLLHLNLKGLAVGNGLTNPEIQYQYYSEMGFKNSHHIPVFSEDTYNMMKKTEPLCTASISKCNEGNGVLDTFACQAAFFGCNSALTTPYRVTGLNPYDIRKECGNNPLCYDFSHVEKFMNLDSTKRALHVDSHNPTWETCNMMINMSFHVDWMKDFSGYVADLLNDGIPALIYAGDADFICNYLGNQAWTLELDWSHSADFKSAQEHDWNNGAGLARSSNGLTFLQVYDAGHMVPSDQPEHALTMITQFLDGKPF